MPTAPTVRLQRRALDPAFDLAAAQVAAGTVPFAILGVADARGVIRLESSGPVAGPRIGVDAICLIASITKPIVATAVMRQVERGRLGLADPLIDALPELERPGRLPFGAWHVLSHTTGLGEVDLRDLLVTRAGRAELLRLASTMSQEAVPGSRFQYTSETFDLLVEAVGRRLGRPFESILEQEVLAPLGMVDTTFDPRPDRAARMAPVRLDDWGGAPADRTLDLQDAFTDLHLAGGGLWSTASDLLRFGRAMLRGGELDGVRVLSRAFLELMTREVTTGGLGAEPDPILTHHYGLGWGRPGIASVSSPAGFGHGGATGTRLWIDPAHDLVYVYLSGAWGLPLAPLDAVEAALYAALPGELP